MIDHPCLTCGACCAFFRVSFYWREIEEKRIPINVTHQINDTYSCMLGTSQKDLRCMSLSGIIGEKIQCSIYGNRPSSCSNFKPSYEDGIKNERCDEARMKHKLKPLTPSDWNQVRSS